MKKIFLILTLAMAISTLSFGSTLKQGTLLTVSNDSVISSKQPAGTIIPFTLQGAVKLSDGHVLPVGTKLFGQIVSAKQAGSLVGTSEVMVTITMIQVDGFNNNISTNLLELVGSSEGKSTVGTVAKTTAIGGLAGAISHDAGKGAGIGAVVGLAGSMLGGGQATGANPGTIYNFSTNVNIEIS